MDWNALEIGGGGFVSGIVTGKNVMYARTDVGGAYKYNFESGKWEQIMSFITEQDKGYLSVDAICIDPTDDDTVYMLCGCAYFSDARTAVFKTTDGGKTWTEHEITDLIQVHGNGAGRQNGEAIAVDPDNPDIIYCGGDVNGLIWSEDGGETWKPVDGYNDLGYFKYDVKWPTWTDHMAKAVASGEYYEQNGVAAIKIYNGKVYVATSIAESGNIVSADVGSDDFTVLSDELPTNCFPSRINLDADGNFLITYVGTITFGNSPGGIYRYDPETGEVEDISPVVDGKQEHISFGSCMSAPDNPDELIATTCGVWSVQRWDDTGENDEYGEWLYRSQDGGKTWISIYPGKGEYRWSPDRGTYVEPVIDYLHDGGYDWVYGKAIHWSGSLVINPENPDQVLVSSGNGVFTWDDIWGDYPSATFHPDGIEEVVCLDFVSVPGEGCYSAIYDYDGFIHKTPDSRGEQYQPNMGSTVSVAYCPQNPKVLVRTADKQSKGYYTLDAGETWTEMDFGSGGGKSAIAQIDENTYRIFKTTDSSSVSYSDDFGKTWTSSQGISGTKTTYLLVEPEDPDIIYGYTVQYNEYWYNDKTKTEPTFDDAHYIFYVSTDGGKTFTGTDLCKYDIAQWGGCLSFMIALNGTNYWVAYQWAATESGKITVDMTTPTKAVDTSKPEGSNEVTDEYTLKQIAELVQKSSSTTIQYWWACDSDWNNLDGPFENYGKIKSATLSDSAPVNPPVEPTEPPTEAPTEEPTDAPTETTTDSSTQETIFGEPTHIGDINGDSEVSVSDVVKINLYLLNSEANKLSAVQMANADCCRDYVIDTSDSGLLMNYVAMIVDYSALGKS